jgi:hypothetical protein
MKWNSAIFILDRSWITTSDSAQNYLQIFVIKNDKLLRSTGSNGLYPSRLSLAVCKEHTCLSLFQAVKEVQYRHLSTSSLNKARVIIQYDCDVGFTINEISHEKKLKCLNEF